MMHIEQISKKRPSVVTLSAMMSVLAWSMLWLWQDLAGDTRTAADWSQAAYSTSLCFPISNTEVLPDAALVALGWMLMVIAMMGPIALPGLVSRLCNATVRPLEMTSIVVAAAAYLSVWLGVGMIVHGGGIVVSALAERSSVLLMNDWVISALILAIAGAFQLSETKARALRACQSCASNPPETHAELRGAGAFQIGFTAGWQCVQNGWALMLLMFAFWPGNLLWMMAIAAIMLFDRIETRHQKWSIGLGVALVMAALLTTLVNLVALI